MGELLGGLVGFLAKSIGGGYAVGWKFDEFINRQKKVRPLFGEGSDRDLWNDVGKSGAGVDLDEILAGQFAQQVLCRHGRGQIRNAKSDFFNRTLAVAECRRRVVCGRCGHFFGLSRTLGEVIQARRTGNTHGLRF